ncbi:MAG: hypothetical protein IJ815_02715 [Lachnospiraceae bacterium]|nr:hypothetical protein [Lachnospiraceae bacterium]
MNRRKALSLLLAASMVFTMNSVAFAAEETTAVETVEATETVSTQAKVSSNDYYNGNITYRYWNGGVITSETLDKILEAQKANKAQSNNSFSQSTNDSSSYDDYYYEDSLKAQASTAKFSELDFSGMNRFSVVAATGSKIKPENIWGKNAGYNLGSVFYVSANGYRVGIKSIKITAKGQKAGDVVKFKFNKLLPAVNVMKLNTKTGRWSTCTLDEAKKAYKDLKSAFKSVKSLEYQSVVCPRMIDTAVSADYVNSLVKAGYKKTVSSSALSGFDTTTGKYDIKKDVFSGLVVTVKNGQIKKVQIPTFTASKRTDMRSGYDDGVEKIGVYSGLTYKIGYKTLKKNKDYTISGNYVVLDPSTTYIYDTGDIANFEVK